MERHLYPAMQRALCQGLAAAGYPLPRLSAVHIPGKNAAAACYLPYAAAVAPAVFPPLLGVPLVQAIQPQENWLLFSFTSAFYSAYVSHVLECLPASENDGGQYPWNRFLCLSRKGGAGCPDLPDVQRAVLLLMGAGESISAKDRAVGALLELPHSAPPAQRMEKLARCGQVYDAAVRILQYLEKEHVACN